ncbi:hypothetical protein cypCar_00038328, partial [Cyprinus carpio]
MNVPKTFPAVTSASTPTGLFTACVPTGISVPPVTRRAAVEEPFLILADHHEIRKISLDGSNYTLLKQ